MTELKHVVPQGCDDEVRVFSPIFDIVRDNGDVAEVESHVNLVHEIQWGGLISHVSTEVAKGRWRDRPWKRAAQRLFVAYTPEEHSDPALRSWFSLSLLTINVYSPAGYKKGGPTI